MGKTVYLLVEGEDLYAHNSIDEALERHKTLSSFILSDASLVSLSFNKKEEKLEPIQVDLKEIAKHYNGE